MRREENRFARPLTRASVPTSGRNRAASEHVRARVCVCVCVCTLQRTRLGTDERRRRGAVRDRLLGVGAQRTDGDILELKVAALRHNARFGTIVQQDGLRDSTQGEESDKRNHF